MASPPDSPAIWLISSDRLRVRLAAGLRTDGMNVVELTDVDAAVAALRGGARPAIVVIESAQFTFDEIADQLRAGSLNPEIVILGETSDACAVPAGARRLQGEINAWRLSRFLRLVIARPALRSVLQASYRLAHEQTPPLVEISR